MGAAFKLSNPRDWVKSASIADVLHEQVYLAVTTTWGRTVDRYKSILAAKHGFGRNFQPGGKWEAIEGGE